MAVVRKTGTSLASSAAATLQPAGACTFLPSSVNCTGGFSADASCARARERNGLPADMLVRLLGWGEAVTGECCDAGGRGLAREPGRDGEAVVGRERHAAVAGDYEGAGMFGGLLVDRIAVGRHHAQRAPGAHEPHVAKRWKAAQGAPRYVGQHVRPRAVVK